MRSTSGIALGGTQVPSGDAGGRQRAAKLAMLAYAASGFVVLVKSTRVSTVLGVVTRLSQFGRVLSEVCVGIAVVASLYVLLQRRERAKYSNLITLGLWTLVASSIIDGIFLTHSFSYYFLEFALVVQAVLVSSLGWQSIAKMAKWILATVTIGSCIAAIAAPSWAYVAGDFRGDRLAGLTPDPNQLAVIATIAIVLELATRRGVLFPVRLGAAVTCLVLADTRAAFIAAPVGILVALIVWGGPWRKAAIVALFSAIAVEVAQPSLFLLSATGSSTGIATLDSRTLVWHFVWEISRQHLFFGWGSLFLGPQQLLTDLPASLNFATNAHNQLLQVLGQSGLVGVVGLLLFVAGIMQTGWRLPTYNRSVLYGVLSSWLVLGIANVVLDPPGILAIPGVVLITLCGSAADDSAVEHANLAAALAE